MLSVDTPEVTARTEQRAIAIDAEFAQLAAWIEEGLAPISAPLAAFLRPKLATGAAGRLQRKQGIEASAFAKQNIDARLTRPDGSKRNLFIRIADSPFDNNNRLLAYVAPNYSDAERRTMPRKERSTFNLDLVEHGWAAPFVIYPSVPARLAAAGRRRGHRPVHLARHLGAGCDAAGLRIPRDGEVLPDHQEDRRRPRPVRRRGPLLRERYCVDMRTRRCMAPRITSTCRRNTGSGSGRRTSARRSAG